MAATLYLCYFGLREPLVQTQVLPYLREVAKDSVKIVLLTFEPAGDATSSERESEFAAIRNELAAEGIEWHWLTYHKKFSVLATAYDTFRGTLFVWKYLGSHKIDVLHGRGLLPTWMGAIARQFSNQDPKLVFDIRGFFPEEYTDAGIWTENGWLYKVAKSVERWVLKKSDGFIVLTERAREILFPESKAAGVDKLGRPVEVIPCCIDADRFGAFTKQSREKIRHELGVSERRVSVYVGSVGSWYLTDEMLRFFAQIHSADDKAFTFLLTQREPDKIRDRMIAAGLDEKDFFVGSVSPSEIPRYLVAADYAVSFIKACYSKQASSPTKIAEYLASGLPVVSNAGIGDVDQLIDENRIGVILSGFGQQDFAAAFDNMEKLLAEPEIRSHCRAVAYENFDLKTIGGARYRSLYKALLESH